MTNGRNVAFASAQEMLGATSLAEKLKLDKLIYPPQHASESFGCNFINSVVMFWAMAGEVKFERKKSTDQGEVGMGSVRSRNYDAVGTSTTTA